MFAFLVDWHCVFDLSLFEWFFLFAGVLRFFAVLFAFSSIISPLPTPPKKKAIDLFFLGGWVIVPIATGLGCA